ncbi:MAG: FAD-dependent oxidoreductase [Puniceicoccaceae bacterium]
MRSSKLNRRQFLGAVSSLSAGVFAPAAHAISGTRNKNHLLIETAHFDNKGGWKLDTQFHNILGFSYLLAHGMGEPVNDARTKVRFPDKGKYHVWVHAKDWCPGDWESPGRFQLMVDGELLPEEFGTQAGWGWQKASPIEVEDTDVMIRLKDLTGFEGRCGAIYFTKEASEIPPADLKELTAWKLEKQGMSTKPSEVEYFDTVIVGGGISGCAAALAASSQGIKVALIHARPVLGGNASSEIRVHTEGIHGKAADFLEQIDTRHWPNGSPGAHEDDRKRHEAMESAEGLELYLNHTLIAAKTKGDKIESVDAVDPETGTRRRFVSPVFIDCTGDGWLGYMAGAEFSYGRESKHKYGEAWDQHGELWSPEKPDGRVMGSSVLWRSFENTAKKTFKFPDVPWAKPVVGSYAATNGEWQWEYSAPDKHQIHDAEEIRDHMFRAIYGCFSNAKKRPENARYYLQFVAYNAGKRESRRLIGDHVYTMRDAADSVEFEDTVVTEKRKIDVHYQEKLLGKEVDFLSEALFHSIKNTFYYIPFRSLYSKNVSNLMMAGRCFSCSHIGLGGPRVMNTCGQMGVATGFAAALCSKHETTPRSVGKKHLAELRKLCGYA